MFIINKERQISLYTEPDAWLFDFRSILFRPAHAETVAKIFYEQFKVRYPFQIGALEVAGIPLAVYLGSYFYKQGLTDINTFFIRKSRKKHGLCKMI